MIILQVRGGLGNQMFQYACIRVLSQTNKNERIYLYTENFQYDDLREYALNNLQLCSNIKIINKSISLRIYRKFFLILAKILQVDKGNQKDVLKLYKFGFLEYLGNNEVIEIPKTKVPIKYFSSVFLNKNYFQAYENIIKEELRVKTSPSDENAEWIKTISAVKESVCVHIRRGDYVTKDNYLVCTKEYYEKAVQYCKNTIEGIPVFFVFSEDINYAKSLSLAKNNIFYVDLNNPDYEELRLMYNCKHFIISNSTFSWWAQYLANNKGIVISPKFWSKQDAEISYMNENEWTLL